jgi:imidazolonepropionase-like amidohydrolase
VTKHASPLLLALLIAGCARAEPSVASGPADPAARPASPGQLVLLGRLFDAERGVVLDRGVIIIDGDRVSCSGARSDCAWTDHAVVRDHGEAMLLPGLIDLHVHARAHYVGAFLAAGVTTVRDANNSLTQIRLLEASRWAPRLFFAGPMLDGEASRLAGYGAGPADAETLDELTPILVASAEQAVRAVDRLADAGVDWIKLYEQLEPEVFSAAIEAARQRGLQTMADIGMVMTGGLQGQLDIVEAAAAGVDTIEHLSGLALAYQRRGGDPLAETLDDALLDELAASLAQSGVSVVSTTANAMQFYEPGNLAWDDLPGAEMMASFLGSHWQRLAGWAAQAHDRAAADRRLQLAMIPRLAAAGVLLGAGSDVPAAPYMVPGGALHQELAAMVRAGLSPTEALRAATWNAGQILGADELGHLGVGAYADIVVVEGDPTVDIEQSRRLVEVYLGGARINRQAALDDVARAFAAALAEEG